MKVGTEAGKAPISGVKEMRHLFAMTVCTSLSFPKVVI